MDHHICLKNCLCGAAAAALFVLNLLTPDIALSDSIDVGKVLEKQSNYSANSPDEGAIVEVLAKIGRAEEDRKLETLESLLAPNFEYRQSVQPEKVQVAKRDEYIAARKNWGTDDKSNLTKITNVQNIAIHPKGELASATAFVTYKYRNFSPRYLETYNFEKIGGAWKLLQLIQIPLHPTKADQFDVQLILVPKIDEAKQIARLAEGNADAVVEEWKSKSLSVMNDGYFSVFAVFREPPPVGAKVTLELEGVARRGSSFTVPLSDKVKASSPYYVLSGYVEFNTSWVTWLDATLSVNEKVVIRKRY
ncbi:MAG: nuclear transport factor 2 family protein [Alphaproteobacteria bacterium]|nr:nuclear transport factor 2 family protein [Alphaproteobacteria bacterium]